MVGRSPTGSTSGISGYSNVVVAKYSWASAERRCRTKFAAISGSSAVSTTAAPATLNTDPASPSVNAVASGASGRPSSTRWM
jgi:hypothetical protein